MKRHDSGKMSTDYGSYAIAMSELDLVECSCDAAAGLLLAIEVAAGGEVLLLPCAADLLFELERVICACAGADGTRIAEAATPAEAGTAELDGVEADA
jgi:hypothetical protein